VWRGIYLPVHVPKANLAPDPELNCHDRRAGLVIVERLII